MGDPPMLHGQVARATFSDTMRFTSQTNPACARKRAGRTSVSRASRKHSVGQSRMLPDHPDQGHGGGLFTTLGPFSVMADGYTQRNSNCDRSRIEQSGNEVKCRARQFPAYRVGGSGKNGKPTERHGDISDPKDSSGSHHTPSDHSHFHTCPYVSAHQILCQRRMGVRWVPGWE